MSTTTLTPAPKYNSTIEEQFDPGQSQLFIITKLIRQIHTADLVRVLAVYPTAGKVGFVDVQPLVQDQDTNGYVIAQSPIYKIPYFQLQGGHSAVILAPVAGDIGLAIFAKRDITNVVQTQTQGAAPTQRMFNSADGLYLGGVLNADPTQWVKFLPAGGIDISAQGNLSLEASGTMSLSATGNMSLTTQGTFGVTATGAATMTAASWVFNGAATFNNGATINGASVLNGSVNAGTNTITAGDVTLPRGSVNNHTHPVTTAPGTTGQYTG